MKRSVNIASLLTVNHLNGSTGTRSKVDLATWYNIESKMATNGEENSESEVAGLRIKVETLRHKLKTCKGEIHKLQKQLNKTERLQKNTEKYNDDLRKQVDKLSAEIHERKKREKSRTNAETQTEDYTWTESDYYNYYYGSSYQSETTATVATETQEISTSEVPESQGTVEPCQAGAENITDDSKLQENCTSAAVNPEETGGASIADIIRATAEEAVSQTGFVFDETSGMYYDHSTSLYYDSASQLYYDANSGMYYYYDAESGRYQFHSRVEVQSYQAAPDPDKKSKKKKKESEKSSRKEAEKSSLQDSKVEEVTSSMAKMKIASYGYGATSKGSEEAWPPCVRVTVVRSPVLQTGTLYIITADMPATIGREKDMDHAIRIPEVGVSKFHAEVYFDQELQCYVLVDQGSQNGTVINGNRILQPKAKSEPCTLTHGDEVKMGDTVLSFHIHSGNDTCDGCEPGQVIAHLNRHKRDEPGGQVMNREDKEVKRQKELKQMKVKYGLKNSEYEGAKVMNNSKYQDRAEKRRQVVGSEGAFHRDDAPASVHVEISDGNKGRKMLEKMGWKKGEGLGKDGAGRKDPIQLKIRKSHAGLGTAAAVSVDHAVLNRSKNQENWEKARERFADTCQTSNPSSKKETQVLTPWVKSKVDE
ncbi:angiogenic factor with G patch and FHA domains 1 isoform X3 [Conger conger]|uniref:angiogenic factor with G patch and FHA domains 1 isoform X3 n=1 Tax=Conger conger TaxID=82655 RepID=UPI002A59CCE8|nr:angiogenic factor with G patch and FHA domains 1 isoform X3 [Conger conger]